MKIAYEKKRFNTVSKEVLEHANAILEDYHSQGFDMTLRQLYYQFVALNLFPDKWLVDIGSGQKTKNHELNYKKLGELISNGRMAGLIDWNHIVDRTRKPTIWHHDTSPGDAIQDAADSYNTDKWLTQDHRVEVWVEKEALAGVFRRTCGELDVPLFACRGYVSQSAQWAAHQRLMRHGNKPVTVLHFGDHDPSGIDMTRDIIDRLSTFHARYGMEPHINIKRLALNMDQVRSFNPPPSPAKLKDPRAKAYVAEFGEDSWELDALNPKQLSTMARGEIQANLDGEKWKEAHDREADEKTLIQEMAERCSDDPEDTMARLIGDLDHDDHIQWLNDHIAHLPLGFRKQLKPINKRK